ncbi:oxygenase MpaB family protein [Salinimicrobium sp. GXAS 041]|uniref:oxygenase MpaB family protein n=1 Tax=Salinimicrobium sp. GXAS 041 TaxID=3400806 RepID=UPI003C781C43
MDYFVRPDSIVREIWGKSDTVLFIFAGAAAEFALNRAVDWLYFTGHLPADPLGRLFSTVEYAGKIVFSRHFEAVAAIDAINKIHSGVEEQRGGKIPQWSYRDVLFMLIAYSINAYELLERRLTNTEKEEIFDVFNRVGQRMKIEGLPENFQEWVLQREKHLQQDMEQSRYTKDLYRQYRKHLGAVRYWLLLQVQQMVCPLKVRELLHLKGNPIIPPALVAYKWSRLLKLNGILKSLLLPSAYKPQIKELDRNR